MTDNRIDIPNSAECVCLERYYDSGSKSCVSCHYTCFLCSGNNLNECTECNDPNDHREKIGNECKCKTGYVD